MQNINLYLPELRVKKEWMTAHTAALSCLGFVLLLLLVSIVNSHRLQALKKDVVMLEHQQLLAEQRLQSVKDRGPIGNSLKLDKQIDQLKLDINSRLLVQDLIEGQSLGNDNGFSSRLQGLARFSSEALSLDRFRFTGGASLIEMSGVCTKPELLLAYLAELQNDSAFVQSAFGSLSIAEKNSQKRFDFSLGYEPLMSSKEDGGAQR
ncbi:hypothetical protein [Agaribacterium haliotis]|uniref:hypothetical protein n=1 Tax=Agaribacterium haliotis TaxID=2013869 RepID=UPI000BB579EF|nr:hypothetical protein [Agaribacterium haliotis]